MEKNKAQAYNIGFNEASSDLKTSYKKIGHKALKVIKQDPPDKDFDCSVGCYYCCHMRVVVLPQEVIDIAHFIKEESSKKELQEICNDVTETAKKTKGLTDEEYSKNKVWCPLLKDGNCSVYSVRPMECRGYLSENVEACKNELNGGKWNVPIHRGHYEVYKYAQAGLMMRSSVEGLYSEPLEFVTALNIALNEDNVEGRWLSGENVFKEAALDETDDEYQCLYPWTSTF